MSKKLTKKNIRSPESVVPKAFSSINKKTSSKDQLFDSKKSLVLYRLVYSSRISLVAVLLLLVSFSLQGVQRVYASEEFAVDNTITPIPPETVLVENTSVTDNSAVEHSSIEPVADVADLPTETNLNLDLSNEIVVSENTLIATSTNIEQENNDTTETVTIENSNDNNSEEVLSEGNHEIIDNIKEEESIEADPNLINNQVTDADGEITEPVDSEIAPEQIDDSLTNYESVSYSQSDSFFSFNKEECTELATGSFYCMEPKVGQLQDALFSAPDQDGDLEIFFVRDGIQVQVTNNNMDDAAPYYDQNTNTIVWHRLIDDRYQIISYDIDEQTEQQLTQTNENNMEPTRQGEYTVWQRWVDGGWNIVLLDGDIETQLTKTTSHNIAPYIHGSLVVWNRHDQNGEKTIEMYDISSKSFVTVNDPEGLSVSNPRMVFVYDSLHPNGDIVTKGYDVLAKKFISLDSLPHELPDEIPSTDSTGETRALIQGKPSIKSEVEESINNGSTTPTTIIPPVITNNGTSTEFMTLDLTVATTSEVIVANSGSGEFDLVIEPFILTEASSSISVQE